MFVIYFYLGSVKELINRIITMEDSTNDNKERAKTLGVDEKIIEVSDELQRRKRDLMELMKENRAAISKGEMVSFEKGARMVGQDSNGNFFIFGKKGAKMKVSFGDIMRSSTWGTNFKLNDSVDKSAKKKFVLMETKKRLFDLYNKQLALIGANTSVNRGGGMDDAYEAIMNRQDNDLENIQSGILAEKMVESFFTKISFDYPEIPFSFESVDIYDDVEDKIDFVFKIKSHSRGMSVETEDFRDIGVQLTMNKKALASKKAQIDRIKRDHKLNVDDIVLVALPIRNIQEALQEWKNLPKNEKLSKAPEDFLSEGMQEAMFKSILEKLPKELNIDPEKYWNLIKKGESEKE